MMRLPEQQSGSKRKVIGSGIPLLVFWMLDARGNKVAVSKAVLREYWRHAYWTFRRWDVFHFAATVSLVLFILAFVVSMAAISIAKGTSPWRGLLALVPILLLAWLVNLFRRYIARELAESWFVRRWCIHCLYNLDRLESEPDGCTICPECGAAWKLNAPLSERVSE